MNKQILARVSVVGILFVAVLMLVAADDRVILKRGDWREVETKYVDRYVCESGARMFVERHSPMDRRVVIRCL